MKEPVKAKLWNNVITAAGRMVLDGLEVKVAIFQLSSKCPYQCKYCYQACGPGGQLVDPGVAAAVIKRLQGEGWLVRPFVAEIVQGIEPCLPLLRKTGVRDVSTAGDPLARDPSWFDKLSPHGIDHLRVLVLPTSALHQDWTGRNRATALDAIQMARARGFTITWNFLLARSTMAYLEGQVAAAVEAGAREFNVNSFFAMGRAKSMPGEALTDAELASVLVRFDALRDRYPKDSIALTRMGMMGPNLGKPGSVSARLAARGEYCFAGLGPHAKQLFIDADLKVYGCLTHRDPALQIGTVDVDGVLQLNEKTALDGFDRKECFTRKWLKAGIRSQESRFIRDSP
ncbi:MAG: radical SAM protein [Candidatus Lokiarchaeota archaeon]|nr:radical SAM protein [Candidatus Lokiarchaeota archaeon]